MMKRCWLIGLACWPLLSFGQHNKDNYNQWASMEFKQWSFTPKSYYYSWYTKRVLGVKIKVPGEGVHDKGPAGLGLLGDNYVNQRWRQMTGLRATAVASHVLESGSAKAENEVWEDIMEKDLLTIADRELDAAYTMTKKERDRIVKKFALALVGMDVKAAAKYLMEYKRITKNISNIRNSKMDNARKLEAYQKENKALKEMQDELQMEKVIAWSNSVIGLNQMSQSTSSDLNGSGMGVDLDYSGLNYSIGGLE